MSLQLPIQFEPAPFQRHSATSKAAALSAELKKNGATQQSLRRTLNYDPSTGVFRWNISLGKNRTVVGEIAGSVSSRGYKNIYINGVNYYAHRVAWLHFYGTCPVGQIDHIDGDKGNNRISNLRDVSQTTNNENRRTASRKSTTGHLGVSLESGKWRARIQVSGKKFHIGFFGSKEEAYSEYVNAKRIFHKGGML